MDWEYEREEKIETLESWIDATFEEIEFTKELCDILERAASKNVFIELAKTRLKKHNNPWSQDNLRGILSLVSE